VRLKEKIADQAISQESQQVVYVWRDMAARIRKSGYVFWAEEKLR